MGIHDHISFNSNEEYERSIFQFVQTAGDMTIKDARQHLDQLVDRTFSKNRFLTYKYNTRSRTGSALFAFDTGFRFQNGRERIFAYTLKNTRREEDSKKFYGLFIERETMLRDEIRSRQNRWHIGDIVFDSIDSMNDLLSRLGDEALYENWTFTNYPSKVSHPILKNYLENTFYQLVHQDKIFINNDEEKMLLNTGLIDTSFNELFLVCDIVKNSAKDTLFRQEYRSPEIYKSSNRVFCNYSRNAPLPVATFYENPGDLLFNWEIAQAPGGITIADEHIFRDNMNRINLGLRDPAIRFNFENPHDVSRCRQMFEGALKASLELSKRNYKFVAPQFWPATGKLQFLMPIYLEGVQEVKNGQSRDVLPPTVALSMELVHGQYIGTTILTLDMAYQNARLIARPDGFWLDATKIFASKAD
jgi:hypothetical protein